MRDVNNNSNSRNATFNWTWFTHLATRDCFWLLHQQESVGFFMVWKGRLLEVAKTKLFILLMQVYLVLCFISLFELFLIIHWKAQLWPSLIGVVMVNIQKMLTIRVYTSKLTKWTVIFRLSELYWSCINEKIGFIHENKTKERNVL